MAVFTGSGVAVASPFKNGKIDFETYEKLINWQIEEGTDCIVAAGTTGEASTMTDAEQIELVECAVKAAAGRVPVIAGAGSNDTHHGVNLSKELQKTGADALLHVTPYYNKCTQKGLILHMEAIADAVDIPVILYSVPGRTGVNIKPETCAELAKHPNIVGIKEASGDIAQCTEIARVVPEGFAMYSGNDDMVTPLLALGGAGVISVLANVAPRDTHDMVAKFHAGDVKGANEIQLKTKALTDALFCEVNPIPVKAALYLMGKIPTLEYRLPLCEPSEASMARIKRELENYGLL